MTIILTENLNSYSITRIRCRSRQGYPSELNRVTAFLEHSYFIHNLSRTLKTNPQENFKPTILPAALIFALGTHLRIFYTTTTIVFLTSIEVG